MAMRRVKAYLQEREGQEVSYEELAAAGLAPTEATLHADLSRLTANPRNGVTIVGDARSPGVHRPYRYDTPVPAPEPAYVTLRLIGHTAGGNGLGQDEQTRRIFEILPAGRLDGMVA
jgi:hypothetical protein